jgi:hypothetical protein
MQGLLKLSLEKALLDDRLKRSRKVLNAHDYLILIRKPGPARLNTAASTSTRLLA